MLFIVYSVSALMSFVLSLHQRLVIYFIFHCANIPFCITLLFFNFLCIFGGNGCWVYLRELSYVDCLLCFHNLLSCVAASPRERRKKSSICLFCLFAEKTTSDAEKTTSEKMGPLVFVLSSEIRGQKLDSKFEGCLNGLIESPIKIEAPKENWL